MADRTSGTFSFREPGFAEGDVVNGGNYSQLEPDTIISSGIVNLTVTGGNFCNCRRQPTWTVTGGNWCQKSFCSHPHPKWVALGLSECGPDCEHLKEIVTITIDGVEVELERIYEDKVL